METFNITYNFFVPVAFALLMRFLTYAARGRDPYGAFSWAACCLPKYIYAAAGALILAGQFSDGRMEPSMHLHALFMGWLVGMVVLHMGANQADDQVSWGEAGLGQKR